MTKPSDDDETHRVVNALNHPLRRQIICFVVAQDRPVNPAATSRALEQKLSDVTYHFRVLAQDGILELKFERQIRGALAHFFVPVTAAIEHPLVKAVLSEG